MKALSDYYGHMIAKMFRFLEQRRVKHGKILMTSLKVRKLRVRFQFIRFTGSGIISLKDGMNHMGICDLREVEVRVASAPT